MRKKIALIFLLLANIVLLAHAVIPHHHHTEDQIDSNLECCEQHEINTYDFDHGQNKSIPCNLTTDNVVLNNQHRTYVHLEEIQNSDVLFFTLFVLNYNAISDNNQTSIAEIGNTPLYSRLLVSSQGLRAPPIC